MPHRSLVLEEVSGTSTVGLIVNTPVAATNAPEEEHSVFGEVVFSNTNGGNCGRAVGIVPISPSAPALSR